MEVVEILFGNLLYKLLSFISFRYIIKSVVYEALMWKYQNNSYGSISFFFLLLICNFIEYMPLLFSSQMLVFQNDFNLMSSEYFLLRRNVCSFMPVMLQKNF